MTKQNLIQLQNSQSLGAMETPDILAVLAEVRTAMDSELARCEISGFSDRTRLPLCSFEMQRDPFDKSSEVIGLWMIDSGTKVGECRFRENGQVFAELDILTEYPLDSAWFVELVSAWGRRGEIKAELKLLPALTD